jgi:hypothetical protein
MPKRIDAELRARAVRIASEHRAEYTVLLSGRCGRARRAVRDSPGVGHDSRKGGGPGTRSRLSRAAPGSSPAEQQPMPVRSWPGVSARPAGTVRRSWCGAR